jgi:hypothetical protein
MAGWKQGQQQGLMVGRGGFKYAGLCREWEPDERNAAEENAINEIGCRSTKALRLSIRKRMVFQVGF